MARNSEGKLANERTSARKLSICPLNQRRALRVMPDRLGNLIQIWSRCSASKRMAYAAGHDPSGMNALSAQRFQHPLAELAQLDAVARHLRMLAHHAHDVAFFRIGVHAEQKVRRGKMEEAESVGLNICARFMMRRSFSAVSGMRTAMMSSQALLEASRWLTGQMPQMRAISAGISVKGRPSQSFSKPRTWVTWKRASCTSP